jgi:hypothetical protein
MKNEQEKGMKEKGEKCSWSHMDDKFNKEIYGVGHSKRKPLNSFKTWGEDIDEIDNESFPPCWLLRFFNKWGTCHELYTTVRNPNNHITFQL